MNCRELVLVHWGKFITYCRAWLSYCHFIYIAHSHNWMLPAFTWHSMCSKCVNRYPLEEWMIFTRKHSMYRKITHPLRVWDRTNCGIWKSGTASSDNHLPLVEIPSQFSVIAGISFVGVLTKSSISCSSDKKGSIFSRRQILFNWFDNMQIHVSQQAASQRWQKYNQQFP